ncbi:MAG: DUF2059 domain-containing protein [Alysiella sp.]|uniref:DUF2059 domain-containing protein n=1 Tax=Alysiella sp. TaxID=1872483 RepID=UPI0026DC67A5|nr:DUF2059 domain-containing protein [Alysiella sp.]MDO4433154.1 DUF2059 domain-containing protein [Alysiella sp.]
MKYSILAATLIALNLIPIARAQTPSDTQLNHLYQAMQIEKQLDELKNTMPTSMVEMMQQHISTEQLQNLNAEQKQRLHALQLDMGQTVFKETFDAAFMSQVKNIWQQQARKHFTTAEVKAATAFYRTPQGQGFRQKTTAMMPEFMQNIMPLLIKAQQDTMQRHNSRWQKELQIIIFPKNEKHPEKAE